MKRLWGILALVMTAVVIAWLLVNLVRLKPPIERQTALVTKVVDGDTIEIEGGARVRYLGIDTPEMNFYGKKAECFAHEATKINRELVLGKRVELEKDVSETDKYGRLLRFIYVDGRLINEELIRVGAAVEENFPPDSKYQEQFLMAQAEARENGRGLWGKCHSDTVTK